MRKQMIFTLICILLITIFVGCNNANYSNKMTKEEKIYWMDCLSNALKFYDELEESDELSEKNLSKLLYYMQTFEYFKREETTKGVYYPQKEVNKAAELLLKRKIKKHQSIDDWKFEDGKYFIPITDPYSLIVIPIIKDAKNDGSKYTFIVDIYKLSTENVDSWNVMPDNLELGYESLFEALASGEKVNKEPDVTQKIELEVIKKDDIKWNALISVKTVE